MVDKIWYDWQNKSPKNKYAYGGGSVGATDSATFSQSPTGLPPYYGVSARSDWKRTCEIMTLDTLGFTPSV